MKKVITATLIFLAVAVSALARAYSVQEVPNVHIADRTRFTSNPDNILSPMAQAQVDSILWRLRHSTTAEVVTVVVDDIDTPDIDTYATELFNLWGLGKADNNNGALLLVAKDSRKAVIRTGPGLEGLLTDAACGKILRQQMFPHFRNGDYDSGVVSAANAIAARLGDPVAAEEIRSPQADADYASSSKNGLRTYLLLSLTLTIFLCVIIGFRLLSLSKSSAYDKYTAFQSWKAPMLIVSFAGLGIPLIVTVPLLLLLNHWRNKPRKCSNCGAKMVKIDEVHDNDFLTPSQDCEERIGSVDYDVWHCNNCGENEIFPFVNKSLPLEECGICHARTAKLTSDRVTLQPTSTREGIGTKEYTCLNCRNKFRRNYPIAKLPPIIVVPTGGRGGGGFGGGSIGGGFGGGFTGGGGASGGW